MAFIATAAIIGGVSAAYGVGKSISQSAQANSIEKNNIRPTYQIPKEFQANVNLSKQMAQIGLPQQQYNNQQNNILRNQSGGLQTLGRSANVGSGVASLVRASNDASNTLNAQDAAARQQNQRFYIGQNGVLGQQKLAEQQYNKFDKYTENFNRAQALRGAANQNMQNAVNGASSMATNLYGLNQMNGGGDVAPQTIGERDGISDLAQPRYLGYQNQNQLSTPYSLSKQDPNSPLYTNWKRF